MILQRRKGSWECYCKQTFTFVYIGMSLVVQCLRICLPMQGMWFNPWQGPKIPHATRQLSPCAITREPMCCNHRAHALQRQCSMTREAPAHTHTHTHTHTQTHKVNRVHGFSLAQCLPGKEVASFFCPLILLSSQGMRAPPVSQLYLNEFLFIY